MKILLQGSLHTSTSVSAVMNGPGAASDPIEGQPPRDSFPPDRHDSVADPTRVATEPSTIRLEPSGIPASMRIGRAWVRYKLEKPDRLGRFKKIPYFPRDDRRASIIDPSTWGTYEECVANVGTHRTVGIGIVLGDEDLICIDLDDVRDPETGVINDGAMDIIRDLGSFTEISTS